MHFPRLFPSVSIPKLELKSSLTSSISSRPSQHTPKPMALQGLNFHDWRDGGLSNMWTQDGDLTGAILPGKGLRLP